MFLPLTSQFKASICKNSKKEEITYQVDFKNCLAKTYYKDGACIPGQTVLEHCSIVGNLAKVFLEYYPETIINEYFPKDTPLIVASHDVGKVSPSFQIKLKKALNQKDAICNIPELSKFTSVDESNFGGHPTVSYATVVQKNSDAAIIVGQHHGYLHQKASSVNSDNVEIFGGDEWSNARTALIQTLEKQYHQSYDEKLSDIQVFILSGLTCVCDWIGSSSYFNETKNYTEQNYREAIENAGFHKLSLKKDLSFRDIFGFSPKDTQSKFYDSVNGPGVYVLEAPMGLGKTEAALYAAYKVLEKGLATGIYFALPTQLTSNKIYERFNDFLQAILAADKQFLPMLLHSNARVVKSEMGADADAGHSWFSSSKRGLLFPFSVGTLDQALLSVVNVRHNFVRSFGLLGKVVILDEVHSYDCYTSTLLQKLIENLKALNCTVIVLSATLSASKKASLLSIKDSSNIYPLISGQPRNGSYFEKEVSTTDQQVVPFSFKSRACCIEEALSRLKQGQQVLWIENTVKEAQELYKDLAYKVKELGCECGLLHSRYTQFDRQAKENHWVSILGKNAQLERSKCGRLLIGTQVLEQSLDIDSDFLITSFAPTDMLLQRVGRLWRHKGTIRPKDAHHEMWIVDVDLDKAIESEGAIFSSTRYVYPAYILCKALKVWKEKASSNEIVLPKDIRTMIDNTYAESIDKDPYFLHMKHQMYEGIKCKGKVLVPGIDSMKTLALNSLSNVSTIQSDEYVGTRYGRFDNIRVLLIKDILQNKERKVCEFTLLNRDKVSLHVDKSESSDSKRKTSCQLLQNIVCCFDTKLIGISYQDAMKIGLTNYLYFDREAPVTNFVIAKVDEVGNLFLLDNSSIGYKYDSKIGLLKESECEQKF
ncbi:MAG: CRISPR-associated helicase Cas3' [Succinivibrio sp.]|nr:CRISPR-associated helicase Cas3' [Succinivibrio sp.]